MVAMLNVLQNTNLINVLDCIYRMEFPTRAKIAQKLNLSRTTVSSLVRELFSLKLATDKETEEHKNGRPGVILAPDNSTWFSCGTSFDQNTWNYVLTNLSGDVVYKKSLVIEDDPIKPISSNRALDYLVSGLQEAIKACPGKLLPRIGIGLPGYVDRNSGSILFAADLGWQTVPVSETVQDSFGIKSYVMNRHMTAGLAESRIGAGKFTKDMIYLGISTGLITCHFCNGEFLIGQNYNQGEVGHTIIDPNGPVCSCGKHGCLQAVASQTALCNNIKNHFSEPMHDPSIEEIYRLANEDPDSVYAHELNKTIRYMAMLCSNLINMFNPERVVIGGPLSLLFKDRIFDELENQIASFVIPHPFDKSLIRTGTLVPWGSSIGASYLVSDDKLNLVCS